MVVLQVNKFFFDKGGSERYFFSLSKALEERGHRVVHFAMEHPKNLASPYQKHFVSRKYYDGDGPSWRTLASLGSFIRSREAALKIGALVDENPPDVAHLHNVYHQLTPSIIEALVARGIPVVMTLHDYKLVCPNYSLFAKGTRCYRCEGGRFHRAVTTRCAGGVGRSALLAAESYYQARSGVYRKLAFLLAPSEYMRTLMVDAGMGHARVIHVPPFVDPAPASAPTAEEAAALSRFPAEFVMYSGRLSAEKGLHVLLDAMEVLPEIPLVVFGDGPERARLEARAREAGLRGVHFAGHVSRALLGLAMRRAVACALPTLSPENAPLSALEAASAGVPIIVSNVGGLPEMAARLGGRVCEPGDSRALAGAIRDAWTQRGAAREVATRTWRDAALHFDRERHVTRIEAVYARAMTAVAA